jgi:hypothetical protein
MLISMDGLVTSHNNVFKYSRDPRRKTEADNRHITRR